MRSDQTATTMPDGSIYLAGGCDGAQTCDLAAGECSCTALTTDLVKYDPVANTYTAMPPMPVARYRHLACAVADTIFYFGGRTLPDDTIITQVDAFSIATGAWTTLPTTYPAGVGSDNSCSTVGGTIYVMGGYSADYSVAFNNTYAFSPATAGWTLLSGQMNVGRGDFSSVAYNGLVHAYGGYTPADFCGPIASHEVYDPVADAWTRLPDLPAPLAEKDDGVVVDGRIFSLGGETKSIDPGCTDLNIVPLPNVYSYNGSAWTIETFMPDGRMRFASAGVGANTVYVFGGQGALVDGNTLPLMFTAYSYSLAPSATPSPSPVFVVAAAASGKVYSHGDMAGAVVGTLACTLLAVGGALLLYRRRAAGSASGASPANSTAAAKLPIDDDGRRLSVASDITSTNPPRLTVARA
jgi:N-acetylneuraminic acid mutarotase